MSYAISKDGQGWRAVNGAADVSVDEFFSTTKPTPSDINIRSSVWNQIKAERDRRTEHSGYKVGTKWFHSDQKSRSQQLGLARKADRIGAAGGDLDAVMHDSFGSPIAWKTMDGSFVQMTARLAQQIVEAAETSDLATFKAAETHYVAMKASPDPAAYDFSGNWPAIYEPEP